MKCPYCDEPIVAGERSTPVNDGDERMHPECLIRIVAGSVGHQLKACSCFGGTEDDPKGLSLREGARAAAKLFCVGGDIQGHA